MGLRFKFNLVLVIIFSAGFATVGVIADRYLQQQATEDAKRAASMVLDVSNIAALDPRIATTLGSRLIEMKVRVFDFCFSNLMVAIIYTNTVGSFKPV